MTDKVFCKDCSKPFDKGDLYLDSDIICLIETDNQHPITGEFLYELCMKKNANCNCQDYETKQNSDD